MEMDKSPLISIENLTKYFGQGETRVDALRNISLDIFPEQVIGLSGPSGSGKSTLLNIIGCILEPNSGLLRLDGEIVYNKRWLRSDLRKLRLEKIGFIFQAHNLMPFLSAIDNIAIVLSLAGFSPDEAHDRGAELLDYLEIGNRADAFPASLSGGEAQRVAIARALANRPRIVLADEPTAALDSGRAGIVMDLLRKVAVDQQAAVVVVTHDEKIYNRLDHISHLRDGVLE